MTKRERMKRLQEIYDSVPKIQCQGLCHDACGPIQIDGIERERMTARDKRTKKLPTTRKEALSTAHAGGMCVHLTEVGRCRIYSDRPLICRAWGVTAGLRCHFGCKPDRYLTNEELYLMHAEIERLSGENPDPDDVVVKRVRFMEEQGYFDALQPTHMIEKAHKSNVIKEFDPPQ